MFRKKWGAFSFYVENNMDENFEDCIFDTKMYKIVKLVNIKFCCESPPCSDICEEYQIHVRRCEV